MVTGMIIVDSLAWHQHEIVHAIAVFFPPPTMRKLRIEGIRQTKTSPWVRFMSQPEYGRNQMRHWEDGLENAVPPRPLGRMVEGEIQVAARESSILCGF